MQTYVDGGKRQLLRHWGIPLLLSAVAIVLMLLADSGAETLRYQREAILDGGVWRLLSGHLIHLGWMHLWLNLAGLWLVWFLTGDSLTVSGWWSLLLWCALFIALGLLLLNPELQWYVGLSGILHGLLLAGLLVRLSFGQRDALVVLVVLVGKLVWEQFFGPMPGSEASVGGTVVVDAHLYGAIAGAAGVALLLGVPDWRRRFVPPVVTGNQ